MKKLVSGAVILFCGIICGLITCGRGNSGNAGVNTREPLVCPKPNSLRNGDFILRHGNSIWSDSIRENNLVDKRFSHIGILVKEGETFFVIHADCDAAGNGRTGKVSLENFLSDARRIGVFRPNLPDADLCAETAQGFVGLPFDRNFNHDDTRELYCSELVFHAIRASIPQFCPETFELCGQKIIPVDAFVRPEIAVEIFDSGSK